jgi:hypothetical protein
LLNPPSVGGWPEGTEWINSGSIVERVNFSFDVWSNNDAPEVLTITERLSKHGDSNAETVVEQCLDLMGPLTLTEEGAKEAIIQHVEKNGPVKFGSSESEARQVANKRISEILALISASKEYQRG